MSVRNMTPAKGGAAVTKIAGNALSLFIAVLMLLSVPISAVMFFIQALHQRRAGRH